MNAEHMEFLNKAITGHIGWRMRINDFAAGRTDIDPAEAAKDNACPLGRWLYGEGKVYAQLPEFRALVADHATFHRCAGDVCGMIATGNVESGAAQLRAEDSTFSAATRTTVASLQRLRDTIYRASSGFSWKNLSVSARLAGAFGLMAASEVSALALNTRLVAGSSQAWWDTAMIATGLLTVTALAYWLCSVSLRGPLERMLQVVENVAGSGDFSKRMAVESQDELGRIGYAFNILLDDVESACTEIGHVMHCMMVGDLSNRITGGMKGRLADMKQSVNVAADGVQQAMKAVLELSNALDQGRLNHRVSAQVQGEFKRTVDQTTQGMSTLKKVVDDIGRVMQGLAQGILDQRVEAEASGDLDLLKQNFNLSLDTLESTLNDVTRIAAGLAEGDLSQTSIKEFPGAFGQTQRGVCQTVSALSGMITEIEGMVEAAAMQGNFSLRSNLDGKRGYVRTLSELLNRLSEVIEASLSDFMRVAGGLAQGDLTQKVTRQYPGMLGKTKDGINGTVDHLTELVQRIIESEGLVSSASKELAIGNADLAQRTSEQASALQETSASLEELSSSVKEKSEHAAHADRLAREATQIAMKGGEVVQRSVKTMTKVTDASARIADIIGVIDGIAFQTNILALNAAVEAARAGDHGRGFAVVAGEVRTLAQRSATAAKEIRNLISASVEEAHNGANEVNLAGKTMQEVVKAITQVTRIMAEINDSSTLQSASIEEISRAVQQMDEVTQQNSALVEESASVAETLENQAEKLTQAVAVFKLVKEPRMQIVPVRLAS